MYHRVDTNECTRPNIQPSSLLYCKQNSKAHCSRALLKHIRPKYDNLGLGVMVMNILILISRWRKDVKSVCAGWACVPGSDNRTAYNKWWWCSRW